jgi:hypothetical protein
MPKPFVFVLMPFAKEFDVIYDEGIKSACLFKEVDMYCERVDKQIYDERIIDRIYNQINKADYIIADLSGRNTNVFYETGYAHALNKKVILLIDDSNDIPFDLKHHPHIIYKGQTDILFEALVKKLKWYKENPERKSAPDFSSLKYYIDGQLIEIDKQIQVVGFRTSQNEVTFDIDINNHSKVIFTEHGEVYLEINSNDFVKGKTGMKLPENRSGVMYSCGIIAKILPSSWQRMNLTLTFTKEKPVSLFHAELKVFTELDTISIPFTIKLSVELPKLRAI